MASVLRHTTRSVTRRTSVASEPSALVLISRKPRSLSPMAAGAASPNLAVAQKRLPP